jgi:coenzyme PQQ precursor peptide PqqA
LRLTLPKAASYNLLMKFILGATTLEEAEMAWTTPRIVEVCVGMEVNAYFPADF